MNVNQLASEPSQTLGPITPTNETRRGHGATEKPVARRQKSKEKGDQARIDREVVDGDPMNINQLASKPYRNAPTDHADK